MKKWWFALPALLIVGLLSLRFAGTKTTEASVVPQRLVLDENFNKTPDRQQELAEQIDALYADLKKYHGYNCAVLVARGNDVLLARGYGYADYKNQVPLDAHTPFRLASVSKPITATAVMMLVERGLVDVNQPVSHYLADFPYEKITVEQLLCHRSGLPNYMHFAATYLKGKKPRLMTNDDLLAMIVRHKPRLEFKPGARFRYSNTNYALLVNIIEEASGETFAEFLQKNIFDPMQMHNSYVLYAQQCPDNAACAYKQGFVQYTEHYLDGIVGDKGICGSTADLYKFHLGLERGLLLKEETQKMAYAPRSFDNDGDRNYGYGWRLKTPAAGDTVIFHNGWYHGFNNVFYRRPADNTVIIVLSNKLNMGIYRIDKLLGILDGKEKSWETEESEIGRATGAVTKPAKPIEKSKVTVHNNAAKQKPAAKKTSVAKPATGKAQAPKAKPSTRPAATAQSKTAQRKA